MKTKKLAKRQQLALQDIRESAEFWLPVFNEEALNCVNNDSTYSNPWLPVEFARRILELAEFALNGEVAETKNAYDRQKTVRSKVKRQKMQRTK